VGKDVFARRVAMMPRGAARIDRAGGDSGDLGVDEWRASARSGGALALGHDEGRAAIVEQPPIIAMIDEAGDGPEIVGIERRGAELWIVHSLRLRRTREGDQVFWRGPAAIVRDVL